MPATASPRSSKAAAVTDVEAPVARRMPAEATEILATTVKGTGSDATSFDTT